MSLLVKLNNYICLHVSLSIFSQTPFERTQVVTSQSLMHCIHNYFSVDNPPWVEKLQNIFI